MTNNLIIVDVQPSYDKYCYKVVPDLIKYLNNNKHSNILYFFNGQDVCLDTKHDVIHYLLDNNLNEQIVEQIVFVEKTYAFFRGWMDTNIDDETIISTGKRMIEQYINDSREIDLNFDTKEVLYIPDFISFDYFKSFNNSLVCGGGRDECLKEMTLLMDMLDIKHKLIEELVY